MRSGSGAVTLIVLGAALTCASVARAQTDAPLNTLEMAMACAPSTTDTQESYPLHVVGAQDTMARVLYGATDLLVLDGGTGAGVQLGQRFFVRRTNKFGIAFDEVQSATTAGWISVVAVNESTAIAKVDHVCGPIFQTDYLVPYTAPTAPAGADRNEPLADPDFSALGHILGDGVKTMVGVGEFTLIDRGADQGVTAGTRCAVYRDTGAAGLPLASIGEGIIVSTSGSTALARITRARDAIFKGDYVALNKK
jgi:hypothetical protein